MSHPDGPTLQRFQFRLSYLIYLLTLFAVGFALLRPLLLLRGDWLVTSLGSVYVAFLVAYFAIRVPLLRRRLRMNAMKLDARKKELANWATIARQPATDPTEDP